jgi:hypothetical protein
MRKILWAIIIGLGISLSTAHAGSCDDCYTTFKRNYDACRGDTTCEDRANEEWERCQVGCGD